MLLKTQHACGYHDGQDLARQVLHQSQDGCLPPPHTQGDGEPLVKEVPTPRPPRGVLLRQATGPTLQAHLRDRPALSNWHLSFNCSTVRSRQCCLRTSRCAVPNVSFSARRPRSPWEPPDSRWQAGGPGGGLGSTCMGLFFTIMPPGWEVTCLLSFLLPQSHGKTRAPACSSIQVKDRVGCVAGCWHLRRMTGPFSSWTT